MAGQRRRRRRSPFRPPRRRSSCVPRHASAQVGETHPAAAARTAAAQRVVFEQPQPFEHPQEQRRILFAQHVHHEARAEPRARRHAFQRARIGLRGDAVDGVLALDLGQLVVQVLAHLRGDAVRIERRVEYRQPRRSGLRGLEGLALHPLHAARDCGRTAGRSRRRDGRSGECALPGLCAAKDRPARLGTARPADCSSSERILPRSELPGT